jgi:hypothetical protein
MRPPPVWGCSPRLAVLCWYLCALSVPAADAAAISAVVYDRGSMKTVFEDNGAAKVELSELKDTQHLYALGTLAGLKGEIIIWDSLPYESQPGAGQIKVNSDWGASAAYLVWSSVPRWQKTVVPPSVRNLQMLELWLASLSAKPGSPLPGQYPFLIKGRFVRVDWHINNVHEDGEPLTPGKVQSQKFHGRSVDLRGQIMGFYDPDQQGLLVPEGRRTHMHLLVKDRLVAHVDDFDPSGDTGLILYVPARKQK